MGSMTGAHDPDQAEPGKHEVSGDARARPSLRLAGTATLEMDGSSAGLTSAKAHAVLARLVLDRHTGGTDREQLAELVWPTSLPPTWGSALRTILTRVRRFLLPLPGTELGSVSGRYVLTLPDHLDVDIESARRVDLSDGGAACSDGDLQSVLATARRGFLPDNESSWAREVQDELAEIRVHCLESLALRSAERGDQSAVALVVEAQGLAPLRESVQRSLMQVHRQLGNRAEAVGCFLRFRDRLTEEMGIAPSRETVGLYLDLLGGSGERPARPGSVSAPFIGRVDELGQISQGWERAQAGATQMVLLHGEVGVGKTRLLNEAIRRLEVAEDSILWCHGSTSGDDAPALAPAFALQGSGHGASHAGDVNEPPDVAGLAAALRRFVAGRGPSTLLLDDVHDLDLASMLAVRNAVVEANGRLPLLLLAAGDPSRMPEQNARALRAISQVARSTTVRLAGLSMTQTYDLTLRTLSEVEPAPLGQLYYASGGNPMVLGHLLDERLTGRDPGPAIREFTRTLVRGTSEEGRAFLDAAAVAGARFDVDLVGRMVSLPDDALDDAVAEVVERGLVGPATDVEHGQHQIHLFQHGAVRDALYSAIPTPRRMRLHARLIEALRTTGGSDAPGYLARHLTHVGGAPAPRVESQVMTAREARRRGRRREARDLLRAALAATPVEDRAMLARVRIELGQACHDAADTDAVGYLRDGLYDALAVDDLPLVIEAATTLSMASDASGESVEEVSLVCDVALAAVPADQVADLDPLTVRRLGHVLVRAALAGRHSASSPLASAVSERLAQLVATTTDPRLTEERLVPARDLLDLARLRHDHDTQVLAAHAGLEAAAVLGCPLLFAELEAGLRGAATAHPRAETHQHLLDDLALARDQGYPATPPVDLPMPPPGSAFASPLAPRGDVRGREHAIARWLWSEVAPATRPETIAEVAPSQDHATAALEGLLRRDVTRARHHLLLALRTASILEVDLHALGTAAIVGHAVGDRSTVEQLYELLDPWRYYVCAAGYRGFAGTASFHLARLAARLERWDVAEHQMAAALATTARLGHHDLWVVLAQRELAQLIAARTDEHDRAASELRTQSELLARAVTGELGTQASVDGVVPSTADHRHPSRITRHGHADVVQHRV